MTPSRILVFRIGQLGDSMVAVPAIRAVRRQFPGATLTLLCDRQVGKAYVLAPDLFTGSGFFEDFVVYPFSPDRTGRLLQPVRMAGLLARLRARRYDTVVYLAPSIRDVRTVARDRRFFALAGVSRFIGFEGFHAVPPKVPGLPLPYVTHEADMLLARLAESGVEVPPPGMGDMRLGLSQSDMDGVDAWWRDLPPDSGRAWVGVGPGSKMPSKVWPEERFRQVVRTLIDERDVWPVVVGGPEDREKGDRLLIAWGRGYNAAGRLSPRQSAEALRRCRLYLGNDSGAMHLAVAAGTPCVAVFSSRDRRGAWYPYGGAHRVLRADIDCEGCMLVECVERSMECLMRIGTDDVLESCRSLLDAGPGRPAAGPAPVNPAVS